MRSTVWATDAVCRVPSTSEPVAEIADYLARLERVRWVVAGGWCDGDFYLSVRSARGRRDAGALLQRIVGRKGSAGGHRRLAAARIELAHLDPPLREQTQQNLVARLIAGLGGTQANQPLLGPEAPPDWREPAEAPLAAPDP